jgi:hypothetical protein
MDIFCDKSGCTNSIASAISLSFEELVSIRKRIEKFGSCLFYVYSFRRGRVASANMSGFFFGVDKNNFNFDYIYRQLDIVERTPVNTTHEIKTTSGIDGYYVRH